MVVFCSGSSPPSSSSTISSDADVESRAIPASFPDDSSVLDSSRELNPLPLLPELLLLELLLLSNEHTLLIINLHRLVPCNLDESMSSFRLIPTSFPNLSRTIISTTRSLHRSDLVIQLETTAVVDDTEDDDSASLPLPLPDADADGRL